MRVVFYLLIFLLSFVVYAQVTNNHLTASTYTIGQSYVIYKNQSVFYKKPKLNSKVLDQLPTGLSLVVVDSTLLYDNSSASAVSFIKVQLPSKKQGYISTADLALGSFTLENNDVLLYQRQQHVEENLLHFTLLDSSSQVSDMGAFSALDRFTLSLYDHRGLDHVDHIIVLDNYKDVCPQPSATRYLSLNKNKKELLYFVYFDLDCSSRDDAITHQLIFPKDCNGKSNYVIYTSEQPRKINSKYSEYMIQQYRREYKWGRGVLLRPLQAYKW